MKAPLIGLFLVLAACQTTEQSQQPAQPAPKQSAALQRMQAAEKEYHRKNAWNNVDGKPSLRQACTDLYGEDIRNAVKYRQYFHYDVEDPRFISEEKIYDVNSGAAICRSIFYRLVHRNDSSMNTNSMSVDIDNFRNLIKVYYRAAEIDPSDKTLLNTAHIYEKMAGDALKKKEIMEAQEEKEASDKVKMEMAQAKAKEKAAAEAWENLLKRQEEWRKQHPAEARANDAAESLRQYEYNRDRRNFGCETALGIGLNWGCH